MAAESLLVRQSVSSGVPVAVVRLVDSSLIAVQMPPPSLKSGRFSVKLKPLCTVTATLSRQARSTGYYSAAACEIARCH